MFSRLSFLRLEEGRRIQLNRSQNVFFNIEEIQTSCLHWEYSLMKTTLEVIVYTGEAGAGAISPKGILN